ncbi:glycosyltransferase family 2 protein [Aeromicrobium fastidiosum]|uniref:Glycosyltransferase n=1 Tax=Aeromicrobium fastidiosum TaxID=52699 RepID=A0A641ANS6_9ACTN|nr:glycosyltransferase [Aeromicrobium fastidiosum]KAA1379744.1 glycosyltransferase [Aeromicrobium fastidiosum]MBP2389232.1 glycosyltransferase involved in cell wall biosynthesis [Aeromicrobium fastidiosum]
MAPNDQPLFSIITPVYDTPLDVLGETVDSVLAQTFVDWEWILVDDCSPDVRVQAELQRHAARDPRIRVFSRDVNGGIVATSNDAASHARGQFIALLDHDDLLTTHALQAMAAAIAKNPDEVDYLYSDEDKVMPDGSIGHTFLKPDWSPERFRHQMYTCHFSVLRTSLFRAVDGFRDGYDGSQDWDLILRATERARLIHHVPQVLYHWRAIPGSAAAELDAKPYAFETGRQAIQGQLERLGIDAIVTHRPEVGVYEVRREPDLTTPTSIIIPTIGSSGRVWGSTRCFVSEAIRSVRDHTAHADLEFVVVYDTPTPPQVLHELRSIPGIDLVLVEFRQPFNFSAKCNIGALHARGDVLIFLNDDVQAESDEVVGQLIAPLSEAGVGMTGAKLLFESNRVQHAGVEYGSGSIYHTLYKQLHVDVKNPELLMNREVSALTGACVALRRDVFTAVGGFTEELPVNFNDVDFSLKIRREGLRLVWLWDVVLWHFESITRSPTVHAFEKEFIVNRWGQYRTQRERYRATFTP